MEEVTEIQPRSGPFQLSLVVPVYNEAPALAIFFDRVLPIVERTTPDYEIICVNDGSRDCTLAKLAMARLTNPRIRIVDLSRNFGKEAALTAGIEYARGDAVIPLDADLQDPPELIPELVAKWREGYDTVIAVRRNRGGDSLTKRSSAQLFYRILGRLSDVPVTANAGDFRIIDRRVVEALRRLPERTRFMKGLFDWVGFRQATICYMRPPRVAGESKWRYWRLWNFALDGIFSSTTLPLRIWTYLGLGAALGALSYMVFIVLRTLLYGVDVPGYASLAAMLLFFSGMNMIGLGILGEYLGRIFIETKGRPSYLVREAIGFEDARATGPMSGKPGDNIRERRGRA
jgi:glycosyltransferase involved in cell wall biosynthesis